MVVSWLEDEGLAQYSDFCSNHIKSGDDLVKMTSADLEKLLGMKKMLHRKKLHLALQVLIAVLQVQFSLKQNNVQINALKKHKEGNRLWLKFFLLYCFCYILYGELSLYNVQLSILGFKILMI